MFLAFGRIALKHELKTAGLRGLTPGELDWIPGSNTSRGGLVTKERWFFLG